MSDTPRTDALVAELYGMASPFATPKLTMVDHARQLERENALLRGLEAEREMAKTRKPE